MAHQPKLKLDRKRGEITNLQGKVVYVRRMRDGEQLYVARSTETPICVQKHEMTERIGVSYDGNRCTTAKDMTVETPKSAKKPSEIESDVGDLLPSSSRIHPHARGRGLCALALTGSSLPSSPAGPDCAL